MPSLFIVVGTSGGGVGGDISTTNPLSLNGTNQGVPNFNWSASAQGDYFPVNLSLQPLKPTGKSNCQHKLFTETHLQLAKHQMSSHQNGDLSLSLVDETQQLTQPKRWLYWGETSQGQSFYGWPLGFFTQCRVLYWGIVVAPRLLFTITNSTTNW